MRSTKIVATLGPASSDAAVLERMFTAGVDVVRLNFSHGTAAARWSACVPCWSAWRGRGTSSSGPFARRTRPLPTGPWRAAPARSLRQAAGRTSRHSPSSPFTSHRNPSCAFPLTRSRPMWMPRR